MGEFIDNNNYDSENYDNDLKIKDDIIDKSNNNDFIHFNSTIECSQFVDYINNYGIKIEHKCCNGLGCCIKKNIHMYKLDDLKKKFKSFNNITETCDICYELKILFTKCKVCKHPCCKKCYDNLLVEKCPFCRQDI